MNQPLQLIFVSSSPNDVEEMVTTIKTSGVAVRSRIAQNAEDLATLLNEAQPHIVLHTVETEEVTLEKRWPLSTVAHQKYPLLRLQIRNNWTQFHACCKVLLTW